MQFGEYILALRERLADLRKSDATLITSAGDDGIRWSSSALIKICNQSLDEMVRLISMYSKSNILKQIGFESYFGMSNQYAFSPIGNPFDLPSDVVSVINVARLTTPEQLIPYINPDVYFTYKASGQPRSEEIFYTILWNMDVSGPVKKIYFINQPVSGYFQYVYLRKAGVYTSSQFNYLIPFMGVDDLLLDIAEKECRDREHNWERSKVLESRILVKLGINIGG